MRTLFHPGMPNGPAGDPVVWVDIPDEGHSLLLDLGDVARISSRKLLRVDHVLVSHTHIDHFIGFDRLLRIALGRRERELVVSGPPGFLGHVQGKLAGYAWNLIESYPIRLRIEEIDDETIRSVCYRGAGGLRPEPQPDRPRRGPVVVQRAYTVEVTTLDHGIPVLGMCLREVERLSVDKDRLLALGLQPGPWLRELKATVRRREPAETPVEALTLSGAARVLPSGELAEQILFRARGQKLGYLCDFGWTDANLERCVELVRDADLLICESAFLHADEGLARERNHLTARQAGELARAAGVRRLATFHFSPRYHGREQELIEEASEAFGGPWVRLPTEPGVSAESEGGML